MTSRTPPDRIRPTKTDLEAARGRTIRDVLAPGLDLVFVGINPGLWSGATGHHFARPGNRFWKSLHAGGFTPRVLSPFEDRDLLSLGLGVTNLVARTTATAAELTDDEVLAGARSLRRRLEKVRPAAAAVLGITAYRTAFGVRDAALGPQPLEIAGARVWVLPNPSGLNAHYQLEALAERFTELRVALGRPIAR
jgi:double-stranded uracil-DNA glycosylase